jgi:hypothetical protein
MQYEKKEMLIMEMALGNGGYTINRVNTIQTTSSSQDEMVLTIKGIYNERATAQIATFAVLQLGKTAEEATNLIDEQVVT